MTIQRNTCIRLKTFQGCYIISAHLQDLAATFPWSPYDQGILCIPRYELFFKWIT